MALGLGLGIQSTKIVGGNTPRTKAFLSETGIVDETIINALNIMDKALISAGLLPAGTGAGRIKALYPLVGGTTETHKFNFVDPRDLNAAFRLEFFGSWTHDASGADPNGIDAYANTFLNQDAHLSLNSASFGVCYNEDVINDESAEGAFGVGSLFAHFPFYLSSYRAYVSAAFDTLTASIDSLGVRACSRISSTEHINLINTTTDIIFRNSVSTSTYPFYFGACNTGGGATFFNGTKRNFMFLGLGLNTTQLTNFSNIITSFNTTLSR